MPICIELSDEFEESTMLRFQKTFQVHSFRECVDTVEPDVVIASAVQAPPYIGTQLSSSGTKKVAPSMSGSGPREHGFA